ncbi:MAG: SMP-30/gluconolactonase/LRE family protein [Anaerolineaceae bacterium]
MTKLLELRIDQCALKLDNELGESPLWNIEQQTLYWLDIERGQLHTYHPATQDYQTFELGKQAGSIAFTKTDELLVATTNGLAFWNKNTGLTENVIDFFSTTDPRMMNDGKVDPTGNFWVGSKGPKKASFLYRVTPNLITELMLDEITISNGMDWTSDTGYFFYADSGVESVYQFKYDRSLALIGDVVLFYTDNQGTPDGLTIDSQGNIWIAIWDGWQIVGLRPSGEQFCKIQLPVSRPTSVAFGGPDLKTLFITSARTGLSAEALEREPLAGSLFSVLLKTPGRPSNKFGYSPKSTRS